MGVLPACMSVHYVHIWCHGNQWRVLDILELVLQVAVSHHVGARSGTQVLWKSSQSLN